MSNIEKWSKALQGHSWEVNGETFSFRVMGPYDRENKRPKISILVKEDGYSAPYATLTYNDSYPVEDNEVLARFDGHHATGLEVALASGKFSGEQVHSVESGYLIKLTLKEGLPE